ncbi:MAG: hypothetical protein GXP42_13090 [Chloroflexi bacterium]|nr:hypothetical protein [Chloroflexota bacterium]
MQKLSPTLEKAWSAIAYLSSSERRALAERLLQESNDVNEETTVMLLQRFSPAAQSRMDELLAKSNEGTLTEAERAELTALVEEYERIMLANTKALLRASRPQLFDAEGNLIRARLSEALEHELGLVSS